MLTGKERSYLRAEANMLKPVVMIGKDGLTDNVIEQIDQVLNTRELIKVKIQNNSIEDARNVANEVAKVLDAEIVQIIGSTLVLFREIKKEEEENQ